MPAEVSGRYGNMKPRRTSGKLIYGDLTHPAPKAWKGQRCASGVQGACAYHPSASAHHSGTWLALCPEGPLLRSPRCRDVRLAVPRPSCPGGGHGDMGTPPLPVSASAPECSTQF